MTIDSSLTNNGKTYSLKQTIMTLDDLGVKLNKINIEKTLLKNNSFLGGCVRVTKRCECTLGAHEEAGGGREQKQSMNGHWKEPTGCTR